MKGRFAQIELARFDKQTDGIEDLYRKAAAARPDSYDAQMALGNWCGGNKKFEESEEHARAAIKIDPDRAGGYGLLGAILAAQKNWTALDPILADAEKQIPDNLSPYVRAGLSCLLRKTDLPRAERYFRKYLTQEPGPNSMSPATAHWRLGQALEQQGRKSEAVSEWQTAVKLDPESPAKQDLKRVK